ncbi:hypothetical protein TRFO_09161 [Tritrichomonas foetus]|uniref:Uncharacterized protein n=1 Tax=Tritrichomonas foetus TaxID=1144522 RepID=A0A1J4JFU5_9EUKA|nr:hypothetical protein TRFO_09161 [Tritrichomonas foetus]|eukprot:OHS97992.1 hypothetical protein TRFO_09161 [Tritrichomonas foetus]
MKLFERILYFMFLSLLLILTHSKHYKILPGMTNEYGFTVLKLRKNKTISMGLHNRDAVVLSAIPSSFGFSIISKSGKSPQEYPIFPSNHLFISGFELNLSISENYEESAAFIPIWLIPKGICNQTAGVLTAEHHLHMKTSLKSSAGPICIFSQPQFHTAKIDISLKSNDRKSSLSIGRSHEENNKNTVETLMKSLTLNENGKGKGNRNQNSNSKKEIQIFDENEAEIISSNDNMMSRIVNTNENEKKNNKIKNGIKMLSSKTKNAKNDQNNLTILQNCKSRKKCASIEHNPFFILLKIRPNKKVNLNIDYEVTEPAPETVYCSFSPVTALTSHGFVSMTSILGNGETNCESRANDILSLFKYFSIFVAVLIVLIFILQVTDTVDFGELLCPDADKKRFDSLKIDPYAGRIDTPQEAAGQLHTGESEMNIEILNSIEKVEAYHTNENDRNSGSDHENPK